MANSSFLVRKNINNCLAGVLKWKQEPKTHNLCGVMRLTFWVLRQFTLHKKWSFPLRISSVNVTKFRSLFFVKCFAWLGKYEYPETYIVLSQFFCLIMSSMKLFFPLRLKNFCNFEISQTNLTWSFQWTVKKKSLWRSFCAVRYFYK